MSLTSFCCPYRYPGTYFTPFSGVSIAQFEQISDERYLTLFRVGLTNPYSYPMYLPKSLSLLAETLHLSSLSCKFLKFIMVLVIR